jgi:hypothetical protein
VIGDAFGLPWAASAVGALTFASGIVVTVVMLETSASR